MGSSSQREFVEHIRREKFGIGSPKSNPLAKTLHEAIRQLSAELYRKDIHFISELLQNAEDNVYGKGVSPSLEFVLTEVKVAGVDAAATLILFNNEVGFQPEHVEALCDVGFSTKKGKRKSGYIGEKGIGFKSVFLVSRTPIVISNGFRFRFTDEASSEANIGYVVPEWDDIVRDADLRQVYGKQELPQTVIVLPLRRDKIEPVREQLKQISPETLLFLSKLRQLVVREDSQSSLCITRTDLLPATQGSDECTTVATVKLAVGSNSKYISEEGSYHLFQQRFPVTHEVEQRKEVTNWDVTIAFPLRGQRINPGSFSGDIYAFLPSDLGSGFPFVVNADFLLVASRETLKFDSPWNIGILSCVPTVFRTAFNHFLRPDSKTAPAVAVRDAYRYIPTEQPQNLQLRKVQQQILDDLKKEDCVLVDSVVCYLASDWFCKPDMGRLIRKEFRSILAAANAAGKGNPVINDLQWYVVDSQVQDRYSDTLQLSLGVPHMTEAEYIECLEQADWLLSLGEALYWEVVCFVLEYCSASSTVYNNMRTVPILKYHKEDGSIALVSVQEATKQNGLKIYLSPSEKGEWLSDWTSAFRSWVSVLFMPSETVRVLKDLKRRSHPEISQVWGYLLLVVSDLSVMRYVQQVIGLMATVSDKEFIILSTEFIYQCVQGKIVELEEVSQKFPRSFPLVNRSAGITWIGRDPHSYSTRILLPALGSLWPKLSLDSGWSSNFVVMSDDYLEPPFSSLTSMFSKASVLNKRDRLELQSYRSYLRSVFHAMDVPNLYPPDDGKMPQDVSWNFSVEQAVVLLEWVTVCQKSTSFARSNFLEMLKQTAWLPTEEHGLRRPTACFDKTSFSAVFEPSDVPCVHRDLAAFRATLADVGVVTVVDSKGCDAVAEYMLEMYDGTHSARDLGQAIRLYSYLQKFGWKDTKPASQKVKIFVPGDAESSSKAVWKESESCVIHDDDGFFDKSLTVLEDIYPQLPLREFFVGVLNVPRQATVKRYCQLWLKWRSDVHEITVDECTRVWKIVSEKWTDCDPQAKKTFVANARVPVVSSGVSGTAIPLMSSPNICFIPDDLGLRSLFVTQVPNVQFVWYPDNSEKMERALNSVYAEIGVKNLSECVHVKFTSNVSGENYNVFENEPLRSSVPAGSGILCPGLFRAILGFLARKEYGLSSSQRQELLGPLSKGVVEISIPTPITRLCTISCLSPPVSATQDNNVMALWSRTDPGKFYRVENDYPELRNSLGRRRFRTQVATTISHGLLWEHPLIANDLTEFLIGLVSSHFELAHVDYELERKNAKLYKEDELFLAEL